ncbi:MAG: ATP/GTP-binding protein [Phototrophicaceae bacterium]
MAVYKVVVTGPFNSGKTEFVKNGSDIEIVETERSITTEDKGIKALTTVAMDFGRVDFDDERVHLYGTPGQTRFSFMWETLAKDMNGFIVLVDATDPPSFPDAAELIETFSNFEDVPFIVVANKVELDDAVSIDEIRVGTGVSSDVTIVSCTAIKKASVRQVVATMLEELHKQ